MRLHTAFCVTGWLLSAFVLGCSSGNDTGPSNVAIEDRPTIQNNGADVVAPHMTDVDKTVETHAETTATLEAAGSSGTNGNSAEVDEQRFALAEEARQRRLVEEIASQREQEELRKRDEYILLSRKDQERVDSIRAIMTKSVLLLDRPDTAFIYSGPGRPILLDELRNALAEALVTPTREAEPSGHEGDSAIMKARRARLTPHGLKPINPNAPRSQAWHNALQGANMLDLDIDQTIAFAAMPLVEQMEHFRCAERLSEERISEESIRHMRQFPLLRTKLLENLRRAAK